jgi:hypothetical protein
MPGRDPWYKGICGKAPIQNREEALMLSLVTKVKYGPWRFAGVCGCSDRMIESHGLTT